MHLSPFQLAGTDDLQSIPVLEARILDNEARVKEALALLGEGESAHIREGLMDELVMTWDDYDFVAGSVLRFIDNEDMLSAEMKMKFELALMGDSIIELIGMITEDIVAYAEEVNTDNERLTLGGELVVAGFSLVAIVLSLFMGLSVTRSITRPLLRAVDTLALISQGDLCVDVDTASL